MIKLASPQPPTCLSDEERQGLAQLELQDLGIPARKVPVQRFARCSSYNIQYRGIISDEGNVRDARIAYEAHRRGQPLRIYGEIRYFVSLPYGAAQDRNIHFAYVDWFEMSAVGEPLRVFKSFYKGNDYNHFILIGDIVCKIALLPVTPKGHKNTVLELL